MNKKVYEDVPHKCRKYYLTHGQIGRFSSHLYPKGTLLDIFWSCSFKWYMISCFTTCNILKRMFITGCLLSTEIRSCQEIVRCHKIVLSLKYRLWQGFLWHHHLSVLRAWPTCFESVLKLPAQHILTKIISLSNWFILLW